MAATRVADRDLQAEQDRTAQLPDRRPHSHRQRTQTKAHQSAAAMEPRRIGGTKAALTHSASQRDPR
jgi:hypothetical protein